MLYDAKNLYSDAQAVSTSAASHTFFSTNIVDHGPLATGNSALTMSRTGLWLNIRCTTALVSTNVGTMSVIWYGASDSALTSSAVVFTAVPAAVASVGWTKGAEYQIPLPGNLGTYARYSALLYTGATHIITAGNIMAVLADAPGRFTAFAQDAQIY